MARTTKVAGHRLSTAGIEEHEAVQLVRDRIGPLRQLRDRARRPKTRSGKILRGTMRWIAGSEDYALPATINDPVIPGN